jgi:diguanylate cyclase (GGDEF)-like protein
LLIENSCIIIENTKIQATISVGATLANEEDTLESIVKRADSLLYKSKESGRNILTIG